MSFEHKAYVFDEARFAEELAHLLYFALAGKDLDGLRDFVAGNLSSLKDPHEGTPLTPSWEDGVQPRDAHQYGDLALTKFYDPSKDLGLGSGWSAVNAALEQAGQSQLLVGTPFGPVENLFDPGKRGSTILRPFEVQERLQLVEDLSANPDLTGLLQGVLKMFSAAAGSGRGLYITF